MTFRTSNEWLCAGAFKLRGLLIAPFIVYLFAHYEPRWEANWESWAAGLVLFLLGVGLRVVSQRHLRYRLAGDRHLARGGPYRFVRNPVYLANILILVGLTLATELPHLAPLVALWAGLIYYLAVLFEERRLQQRYGDVYRVYCAQVPRWLPGISPIPQVVRPGDVSAPWGRAIAAEWHCSLLLLVPILKEILEHYSPDLLV